MESHFYVDYIKYKKVKSSQMNCIGPLNVARTKYSNYCRPHTGSTVREAVKVVDNITSRFLSLAIDTNTERLWAINGRMAGLKVQQQRNHVQE